MFKTATNAESANELQSSFDALLDREVSQAQFLTELRQLLLRAGASLNDRGEREIAARLVNVAPLDLPFAWFAIGIAWGRHADDDPKFIEPAIKALKNASVTSQKAVRHFAMSGMEERLAQVFSAGRSIFAHASPDAEFCTLDDLNGYQQRMFLVLREHPEIRSIGSWHAGAMFQVAILSRSHWRSRYHSAYPRLPLSEPILQSLEKLHDANILVKAPERKPWHRDEYEPRSLISNNRLIEQLCERLQTDRLIDIHSGLYLLSTKNRETAGWFAM